MQYSAKNGKDYGFTKVIPDYHPIIHQKNQEFIHYKGLYVRPDLRGFSL
jgi:hypothetical protein